MIGSSAGDDGKTDLWALKTAIGSGYGHRDGVRVLGN